MNRCKLCKRALDTPNDPLSIDCGGDCLGCMIEIEKEVYYKTTNNELNKYIKDGMLTIPISDLAKILVNVLVDDEE